MYAPTGYYAVHDDSYELLCPECAREEARLLDLALDSDAFAPVWEWEESDTLEFCANCYERVDIGLTSYGVAELREYFFEALRNNRREDAAYFHEILAEHGEYLQVFAYGVARIGYEPKPLEAPFDTYHAAATAMLAHFETYPPELIDAVTLEWEDDNLVAASIDFFGGTYATVFDLEF